MAGLGCLVRTVPVQTPPETSAPVWLSETVGLETSSVEGQPEESRLDLLRPTEPTGPLREAIDHIIAVTLGTTRTRSVLEDPVL